LRVADLVPRRPAEVGRPTTTPVAPAGQNVDAAAWNGAYLRFEDLGAVLPGQPGPIVAQLARELSGVRRSADGRHFRRRLGWRAERGRLAIVEMDQTLGQRGDGRFAPMGAWSITGVRIIPALDVARRVGDVPEYPPPPVSFPGAAGAGSSEGVGSEGGGAPGCRRAGVSACSIRRMTCLGSPPGAGPTSSQGRATLPEVRDTRVV
jgi:hypothetical protein